MKTLVHLTESDFEYETSDGKVIPVLDFGEASEYYITYGHIPFEEMEEHVRDLMVEYGFDLEEIRTDELSWRWAIAYESSESDNGWLIKYEDISSESTGSFPITLYSVW